MGHGWALKKLARVANVEYKALHHGYSGRNRMTTEMFAACCHAVARDPVDMIRRGRDYLLDENKAGPAVEALAQRYLELNPDSKTEILGRIADYDPSELEEAG